MKTRIIVFLLSFLPLIAYADKKGKCGQYAAYHFEDATGTLTIEGKGDFDKFPWGKYKSNIKIIIIKEGITDIPQYAFYDCMNLTTVKISDGLVTIGDWAFGCCKSLYHVIIPNSITNIGEAAFKDCNSLTTVSVLNVKNRLDDESIEHTSNSSDIANCIGNYAFDNCKSLITVEIPNKITSIGTCAFYDCENLSSITIPNGVIYIGKSAFNGCKNLISIKIPNTVKSIELLAFYHCESLNSITIPNSVSDIGEKAFNSCYNLSSISIGNGVTNIGRKAFEYCSRLKSITIGSGLKGIRSGTFLGCDSITAITFLNKSTAIESSNFEKAPIKKVTGLTLSEIRDTLYKLPPVDIERDSAIIDWSGNKALLTALNNSFSRFATSYISDNIKKWQQKGEFEPFEQYRNRINKNSRDSKVEELKTEAQQHFLNNAKKKFSKYTLGEYDADRQIFTLSNSYYGDKAVKVNLKDAPTFKANFANASYNPTFVIYEDYAVLSDLGISVNGKTYHVVDPIKQDFSADVAINLPPLEFDFGRTSSSATTISQQTNIDNTIDLNIPATGATNNNTFAVIIGNENYTMVAKVPHAKNDAQVLAEYCRKTLGLPHKNVRTYGDATYAMLMNAVKDIQEIATAYNGNINVLFYYAGHGIPDEKNKEAYLLPVDADGHQVSFCYPVSKLYQELGSMNAKNVIVFMDACFSGAQRGEGMLASARGVALKAKASAPKGNMVVFSAATGDETAFPYREKGHGLFTYFLLKKLRDTKGDCTLGELGEYIQTNVRQQSVVVNRKSQTPTVVPSTTIAGNWKGIKLK